MAISLSKLMMLSIVNNNEENAFKNSCESLTLKRSSELNISVIDGNCT